MCSFLYNHLTAQWEPVHEAHLEDEDDVYRVPNLPGDEESYMEIPANKARDPRILRTLAQFRPPLAEADGNGQHYPRLSHSVEQNDYSTSRKRSIHDLEGRRVSLGGGKLSSKIHRKLDCDQVRQEITDFIREMRWPVSDFTMMLGVSNPSYYRFMGQSGPDKGRGSEVYAEAETFFSGDTHRMLDYTFDMGFGRHSRPSVFAQKDNEQIIDIRYSPTTVSESSSDEAPARSQPRSNNSSNPPQHSRSATTAVDAAHVALFAPPLPPITGITLPDELTDSYANPYSCDQIRALINAYFDSTKDTQASFLRTLMAQYHTEDKKIQSVQLQRFRGMRGERMGETNPVFYAAGVWVAKLKEGRRREKEQREREGPVLDPEHVNEVGVVEEKQSGRMEEKQNEQVEEVK